LAVDGQLEMEGRESGYEVLWARSTGEVVVVVVVTAGGGKRLVQAKPSW
jgi:hypothetical protein